MVGAHTMPNTKNGSDEPAFFLIPDHLLNRGRVSAAVFLGPTNACPSFHICVSAKAGSAYIIESIELLLSRYVVC